MCLDTVWKTKPKPGGVGYKVFRCKVGAIYGRFGIHEKPRPQEMWIFCGNFSPSEKSLGKMKLIHEYIPGWHIYATLKGALDSEHCDTMRDFIEDNPEKYFQIRKVKYRGGRVQGRYSNHKVIVADEIYILPANGE